MGKPSAFLLPSMQTFSFHYSPAASLTQALKSSVISRTLWAGSLPESSCSSSVASSLALAVRAKAGLISRLLDRACNLAFMQLLPCSQGVLLSTLIFYLSLHPLLWASLGVLHSLWLPVGSAWGKL